MNTKRFAIAVIAVFVFVNIFEMLFHGQLMGEMYAQTAHLWRTEADMQANMSWMWLGYAVYAIMFCYVFLKGYQNKGIMEGVRYGALIGLLMAHGSFIFYAVMPITMAITIYWAVDALVLSILSGVILAAIYKPQ